jgi:two-component system nitrate/nitrite response regulator NarL
MAAEMHVSILGKSEIIREGLRRILTDQGFVVDATSSSSADFAQSTSNMTIVDAQEISEGIQSCVEVRELFPNHQIVLMMDRYRMEDVARAFATGAVDGYLVKAISCVRLAAALRLVAMGQKMVPSEMAASLPHALPQFMWGVQGNRLAEMPVSERETEILRCLIDGDPNKVISRRLGIAEATVKVHIKAILRKLSVQNRTQAAIWAARRGMNQLRVQMS